MMQRRHINKHLAWHHKNGSINEKSHYNEVLETLPFAIEEKERLCNYMIAECTIDKASKHNCISVCASSFKVNLIGCNMHKQQ